MAKIKIPRKPKTPKKVFTDGVLEYTIVGYSHYVSPGDTVFKEGWFPIKKINFDHPKIQAIIQNARKAQEEILARKNFVPSWEHMNRPMDF